MTRRERLEARAARRLAWADKAQQRSDARLGAANRLASQIPLGQPILVGHHSEGHARHDQERIHANMRKGIDEGKLAEHHAQAADGIQSALDRSIYDDDPDALEQLDARIARRTAEADRMVAQNKAFRKLKGDVPRMLAEGIVTQGEVDDYYRTMRVAAWQLENRFHAGYAISNLRGTIAKDKDRRATIARRQTATLLAADEPAGILIRQLGPTMRITFAEKPDRVILDELRSLGFWWDGGSWSQLTETVPPLVAREIARA